MVLRDSIPDRETLLGLEPEELGEYMLRELHSWLSTGSMNHVHPANFCNTLAAFYEQSGVTDREIRRAIREGWDWLQAQGLVSPDPAETRGEWYIVSRRGERLLAKPNGLRAFRAASQFPSALLHSRIAEVARGDFLRGEYESAIFKAFRELEVAVREAGGFSAEDYGVELMRKAFGPGGQLEDLEEPAGERQALAHLMAGSIGRFKNPTSHRHAAFQDPAEGAEIVMLASQLYRVVERARKRNEGHEAEPDA